MYIDYSCAYLEVPLPVLLDDEREGVGEQQPGVFVVHTCVFCFVCAMSGASVSQCHRFIHQHQTQTNARLPRQARLPLPPDRRLEQREAVSRGQGVVDGEEEGEREQELVDGAAEGVPVYL